MALRRGITLIFLGVSLSLLPLLLAVGCKQGSTPAADAGNSAQPAGGNTAQPGASNASQVTPSAPVSDRAPNEMGRVPVLEYHQIAAKEGRWARTPANFRKDLEWLYAKGFRPVSMKEYVTGEINLPKGASPVLFTFDDADPGQFRYLEKDGKQVIDPDCAVGMLEDFHRKHADWGLKATFYVLPFGFGQAKYTNQKFKYLVDEGFDLGNHTVDHLPLRKLSDAKVQEELAGAQKMVQAAVPGYQFFSLALPLGIKPKNSALSERGSSNGMSYHHQGVLLVGSAPALSPYSRKFDAQNIPRVQATDELLTPAEQPLRVSTQLARLVETPGRCYVSDGDPKTITVPAASQGDLDSARTQGKQIKTD